MHIAVTTDFSGRSREAFGAAGLLARKFSADLDLVHHAQPSVLSATQDVEQFYSSLSEKLSELAASDVAFEGLDVQAVVVRGGNITSFVDALHKRGIDLLVIATHGRTGVARFLLGSFAERAIRFSHCPVLVCRVSAAEGDEGDATIDIDLDRMLVAYDLSPQSRVGVDFAHRWAEVLNGELRLLHVVDSECGVTGFEIELFSDWHEYHAEKKKQADKALQKLIAGELVNVKAESRTTIGHPVLEILSQAEDFNADLIIMGTHGGPMIERWLLGTVAEKVVRKASCPVLLVREPWSEPDPAS